jgi:hypothetical protein
MANTKLSAFLSLLLVFCSGIVVGVVGVRVYTSKVAPSVRPQEKRSPEEYRKQLVEEMTKEVHLDDQQVIALKQIYEDTRANFDEARSRENAKLRAEGQVIHDQQVEKIKKLLRPDQVPLYDALRARHEAERKKMQERHKGEKGDIRKDQ